jgi:hypothetical protein
MTFDTIHSKIKPVTENDYYVILFSTASILELSTGELGHVLLGIVFAISAILSYTDWW